jgi:flagella basal body P-ring formation protein FlgA
MIRIVVLAAAVTTTMPATAQNASLLSPVPLTSVDWASTPVAKKAARLPQEEPVRTADPALVPAPALASIPAPPETAGPALKRQATVTGEIVRIGDLVENAGAMAEVAIFRAPDLGQTGSVPASRVVDAVRSHQMLELDLRGLGEVRVTRASRAVGIKDIEARLVEAIATQYGLLDTGNLAASFDGELRSFHIEPGAEIAIARLSYDQRTRRFEALLDLPNGGARRPVMRATGTLVETAETVVPLRTIAKGEVIKTADVRIERRPKTDAATIEEVVGHAAKQALKPGQVIRSVDVMKPELVARNDTVTISFEVPGMVLTVLGKAIEAGALGDVINVLNVQSKRTIQATVRGPGRVSVTAATPRLAVNATIHSSKPQH